MKSRLGQSPQSTMRTVRAAGEIVPHYFPYAIEKRTALVEDTVVKQGLTSELGIADHYHGERTHANTDQVSVGG